MAFWSAEVQCLRIINNPTADHGIPQLVDLVFSACETPDLHMLDVKCRFRM